MVSTEAILERLSDLAQQAARRGRIVSVTAPVELTDPAAAIVASRRAADRWFCWSEPDRGFELAAAGCAAEVVSRGPERFSELTAGAARALRDRRSSEPGGLPAGAGPVWVGGLAFDPEGGGGGPWSSFPPALLVLPEVALLRTGGRTLLTACMDARGGLEALGRIEARLATLGGRDLPLLDPHPTGGTRIEGALPPEAYEEAVGAAVARIRAGELSKVVMAREVRVHAAAAHDPAATFGALRELFPSCLCFCAGSPEGAFLGASPELLVRRRGAGVSTVALAGSAQRSADPAVDDHLGEQLLRSRKDRSEQTIVARRIERSLRPHAVWVETAADPVLVKVSNIQHLASPIRAQLAEPRSAVEAARLLHPTPAVGGEPKGVALATIRELEGLDRGWYAGPVGWMDTAEDGDFCVGLRSALLRDRTAHLFAGAGIVADSDPAAELAETELKLGAMLPLVAG